MGARPIGEIRSNVVALKKIVKVNIGVPRGHSRADNEIRFLVEKYIERHPDCLADDGAIDVEHILEWAFDSRIYHPEPVDPKEQLRRRLNRNLGLRYLKDDDGNDVRALVAVPRDVVTQRGVRRTFRYFPLFDTLDTIVKEGLDLRRRWAYKRVQQIDTDWKSYNKFNRVGGTIGRMSFDFDAQLKQDRMPSKYPKKAPHDIDKEDDKDPTVH
jgi:hypothetical protein